METSFPRYLLAKQTVDDRALNRPVYQALAAHLPTAPVRITEIGAGIGTMPARLLRWGLLEQAEYVAVDESAENIAFALDWLPGWCGGNGLQTQRITPTRLRISDSRRDVLVDFVCADVFDFIRSGPQAADLLVAHAVLDLLPLPQRLPEILSLLRPGGLAWLTLNFDGLTTLEPVLDPALDAKIERLFHLSMDERPSGGDSRTGRRLFGFLQAAGVEILAAGTSDWVVHPQGERYPADEAYFLNFILLFFEQSLGGHPDLDPVEFSRWLAQRRRQVERGELVYIAHQMDFLVRK